MRIIHIIFLCVLGYALPAGAAFDFYTEECSKIKVATGKCDGKLVDGPRCLKKGPQECTKFKEERKCGWKATGLGGATQMVCETTQGECLQYAESCAQYEKICQGGSKKKTTESCKKKLKPMPQIKGELALAIFNRYVQSFEAKEVKPLHASIAREFQPHFGVSLGTLSVAQAKDSAVGPGVTDCQVMYFSDAALVNKLVNGETLTDEDDVMYLLHALRHAQHCQGMGGRDIFAKEWFREVPVTVKDKIEPAIDAAVKEVRSNDMEYLHTLMPIEEDAVSYSISMLPVIQSTTRHGKGSTGAKIPKSKKDKYSIGVGVGSPSKRGIYGNGK